jgi:hypothetical protein
MAEQAELVVRLAILLFRLATVEKAAIPAA